MNLRIWHIPQVPSNNPYHIPVKDVEEAVRILPILWNYDTYQFENKIKPDYSNVSGLECWNEDTKEWEEYYDDNGNDINEIIETK